MKQGIWIVVAACSVLLAGFMIFRSVRSDLEELPKTNAVLEGTITYNGDPVPNALVIVAGTSFSATSFLSTPGKYQVQNAPLGDVKIAVNTAAAAGRMRAQVMAQSKGKPAPGASAPGLIAIPEKFANPESSGITTNIKEGSNTFDIAIKG